MSVNTLPVAAVVAPSPQRASVSTASTLQNGGNAAASANNDFGDFFDAFAQRPPARSTTAAASTSSPLAAVLPKPPSATNPISRLQTASSPFASRGAKSAADPFSDLLAFTPQTRAPIGSGKTTPSFGTLANNQAQAAKPKPIEDPLDFLN